MKALAFVKKTSSWKWFLLIAFGMGIAARVGYEFQHDYSEQSKIENFPLYEQPDGISCGPTSCRMLLEYYGHQYPLDEIRKVTKTDWWLDEENDIEIGGSTIEYVKEAMNHFGVPSTIKKCSIEDLKQLVYEKRPPIVLLRSGDGPYWHYVVAIGYTEDQIIVADPGDGKIAGYDIERFERAWAFTHDLYGGEKAVVDCKVCGGDGVLFGLPKPLGNCDVCGGTGELHDLYFIMMMLSEQGTYLVVVPKEKGLFHSGPSLQFTPNHN